MDFDALWNAEESFWTDGPEFYEKRMMADACMVFPSPVGILEGEEILNSLREAPRWQSVDFLEKSQIRSGNTIVLAYKATADRKDSQPYIALCSSTYVSNGGNWKLLSHQQTPEM